MADTQARPTTQESSRPGAIAAGAALVVIGALCLWRVVADAHSNHLLTGVLLVLAGFAEGAYAVAGDTWGTFAGKLVPAFLFLLCGMIVLADPLSGSFILSIAIVAFVVTGASYRILSAWRLERTGAIRLLAAAALVALAIIGLLLWWWPVSGTWVLGTVAGLGLIAAGGSWLRLGLGHEPPRARA